MSDSRSRTSSFNSTVSESERRDAFSSDEEIGTLENTALMESRKELRLGSINSLQRSVRHVIHYNVLVAGESRLGKSTIIEQLLQSERTAPRSKFAPVDSTAPGAAPGPEVFTCRSESEVRTMMLKHKRSKLVVSLIETPGFGPSSMGADCWEPVFEEIEGRVRKYMSEENNINRRVVVDHRIHCCIYFLSPFASGLRPVDVEFMTKTCKLVNMIPVIAKVDTLTTRECKKLKAKILEDCAEHEISLFHPELFDLTDLIAPPYTVIGGENAAFDAPSSEGESQIVGRQYPWGLAEVTNEEHCDYVTLHDIILRSCIEDFIDYTDGVLYENYRMNHLKSLDVNSAIELLDPNPSPTSNTGVEGGGGVTDKEQLLRDKQFQLDRLKRQIEQISQRMSESVSVSESVPEMKEARQNQDPLMSTPSSERGCNVNVEGKEGFYMPESTL